MALRISQQKDDAQMSDNVKLISIILLSICIFFGVLFFVSFNIIHQDDFLGQNNDDKEVFTFLIVMLTLSIAIVSMEFYHIRHRSLSMLKYVTIIGNAVIVGLTIHQLSKGYDALFEIGIGGEGPEAIMYTYASLATGFAGIGTLLAVLHNFHGIAGSI